MLSLLIFVVIFVVIAILCKALPYGWIIGIVCFVVILIRILHHLKVIDTL